MKASSKLLRTVVYLALATSLTACGKDPLQSSLHEFASNEEMLGHPSKGSPNDSLGNGPTLGFPDPTQGPYPQPSGFYSSRGRLSNATSLGNTGQGFYKIFLTHDTAWTSFDSAEIIKIAAAALLQNFPNREPLQIGDISSRKGGQLFSHLSHQNGLDTDVRLLSKNGHSQDPFSNGFDEIFVAGTRPTANFDVERNWAVLQTIVKTGRVDRIFIDEVLKKALCEHAYKSGITPSAIETLRRLRHFPGHQNHFHLRVNCPLGSPQCIHESFDVPAGSGCAI